MMSRDLSKSPAQRTRRVGSLLVTATLLTTTGAIAAPNTGRATRSFLVDVEPGTASFGRIDVTANDGTAKTEKTRVAVKVSAALKDANQSAASAGDKKKKKAVIKDHDLAVEVSVSASDAAQSVDVPDLNFDGYRDLWLLRELGANGSRYDVFLFDAKTGKYAKSAFSNEIEKLDSPEIEPMSKTLTSRKGGDSPARTTYRVANSRLDVVSSCSFEPSTATQEGNVVTGKLTQKKLTNGQLETTKKDVAIPRGTNPCAD